MPTNATELMRLMVVREAEPAPPGATILLNPSDRLRHESEGMDLAAARAKLLEMGAAAELIYSSTESVPRYDLLIEFRRRVGEEIGTDPESLVKAVFAQSPQELTESADWREVAHKLSDSILVLKLAYRGGPRPLRELADAFRAIAAIERIASGEAQELKSVQVLLSAPITLPAPWRRSPRRVDAQSRLEDRKEEAKERAIGQLRKIVELHESAAKLDDAINDLRSVPINAQNFVVTTALSDNQRPKLLGRGAAGKEVESDMRSSIESAAAARWASFRDASSGVGDKTLHAAGSGGLRLTKAGTDRLSEESRKLLKSLNYDPTAHTAEQLAKALATTRDQLIADRDALQPAELSADTGFIGGIGISSRRGGPAGGGKPPITLPPELKLPPGLHIKWDNLLTEVGWPGQPPAPEPEVDAGPSMLLPAGVGQLYVIKQQIIGYRSGEVSHVENILPGETRERHHRRLQQIEESTTEERTVEQEEEKSLQTTTRAELEREVQSTIKRQFDYGATAQVSGDYGKVEFSASGQVQGSTATETASKTAQKVASEVVETSRQRVTERIRTERTRRMLDEIEETNLHKFEGTSLTEPLNGVYQWIDKVYRNEVWSYGNRTMYEIVVPEPAAGMLAAAAAPAASSTVLVEKPVPLQIAVMALNPERVAQYCALYGVTEEIEAYPEQALISIAFSQSSDKTAEDNFYAETKDIDIPDGYQLVDGWLTVRARGENQRPLIGVTVGTASNRFRAQNIVADTEPRAAVPITFNFDGGVPIVEKLQAAIAVDDYSSFAVSVTVRAKPSDAHLDKWRRKAFAAIRTAYDARLAEWREYQSQLDFEKPEVTDRLYGRNPTSNKAVIRQELQREAIEIFRNASLNFDLINSAMSAGGVPRIDFASLSEASPEIMFLCQAFEWENMTYILYPYFFGRRPEWPTKMLFADVDANMVEFLKSGAARVQVPVRPGFEAAVDHFMMTREPYFGQGLPQIGDDLYLPYVDEARAAFGVTLGGTHHDELDFDVTVPTTLVVARAGRKIDTEGGTLPSWVKSGDQWVEAPA